jgi:hypothetical protein
MQGSYQPSLLTSARTCDRRFFSHAFTARNFPDGPYTIAIT